MQISSIVLGDCLIIFNNLFSCRGTLTSSHIYKFCGVMLEIYSGSQMTVIIGGYEL